MNPDQEQRLVKLEEGQAFGERAVEELGGEVRALAKKVAELGAVIKRVEAMLSEVEEGEESDAGE